VNTAANPEAGDAGATNEPFGVPELDDAAGRVQRIHDERARLLEQQLATEQEFVAQAAAAHRAGELDWWGLLDAYDRVREWNVPGFSGRWRHKIPYDRNGLRRMAEATPRSADGTWSGNTGWDGLDDSLIPARSAQVVYALYGNGGVPVRIGMTNQFRAHVKRLHHDGVVWESWKAWPCKDRQDAIEVRKRIVALHNQPNAALATAAPETAR
jgi:hypothetical protein